MRKLALVVYSLVLLTSVAGAQEKIESKWTCPKAAAEHHFDVGDVADHTYTIAQGNCTAASGGKDFPEKSGQYTEFDEVTKGSMTGHGRFNVTMDNGDKVYYTYETTGSMDPAKANSNKWKIVGGTGKYKGIKGSGSCTGKRTADGGSDWECNGTRTSGK